MQDTKTDWKMKNKRFHTTIFALWVALATCAGCTDDLLSAAAPDPTPDSGHCDQDATTDPRNFIVTYSLDGEDTATRASDPQANHHIRSLDYYVYFKSGSLCKKRHIRGINASTHWPIADRQQMSWELRQDLQDTLPEGYDYRILFVANVSPTLFAQVNDPQSGEQVPQQIVRDDKDYHTARIVLPHEQLTDSTMFYMWEGEINRTAPDIVDGSSVKPQGIVLRRIVARTDFVRSVEAPTPTLPGTDAHLCEAIRRGFYADYRDKVAAAVAAHIEKFCGVVNTEVVNFTAEKGYPFYGPDGEAARLNAFLRAHTADIAAEVERTLLHDYVARLKGENGRLWRQADAWEGMTAEMVYSADGRHARANALGFDRSAHSLPDVTTDNRYTVGSDGRFTVIGFAGEDFNHLTAVRFTDPTGAAAAFEIAHTDYGFTHGQGLNTRRLVTCNPISAVTLTPQAPIAPRKVTIDLRTLLGDMEVTPGMTFDQLLEVTGNKTKDWYQGSYSLHGYMEWYVFHVNHHSNDARDFGNSFSAFEFPFAALPDLTETKKLKIDQMIEVTPAWQAVAY